MRIPCGLVFQHQLAPPRIAKAYSECQPTIVNPCLIFLKIVSNGHEENRQTDS